MRQVLQQLCSEGNMVLAENTQPESLLPNDPPGSQRAGLHTNRRYFTDLGATGDVLPAYCHVAKTQEDSAGRKGQSSRVWMKEFYQGVQQVGGQTSCP